MLLIGLGIPAVNLYLERNAKKPFSSKVIYDTPDTGVVRLMKPDGFTCSGVVISSSTILTASHCVRKLKETFEIRKADNVPTKVIGTAEASNWRADMAVIKGDFQGFTILDISDTEVTLSAFITPELYKISCGYPYGGQFACIITNFLFFADFRVAMTGPLWPGMSGGSTIAMLGDRPLVIGLNVSVNGKFNLITPLIEPDAAVDMPLHGQTVDQCQAYTG